MPQDKADAIIIDYDIGRKPLPDILADYRQWMSMQEDRIGTHSEDCHLWPRHDRCMIHRLAAEVERLRNSPAKPDSSTITDAERNAVACGLGEIEGVYPETAATIRSLLERLSP